MKIKLCESADAVWCENGDFFDITFDDENGDPIGKFRISRGEAKTLLDGLVQCLFETGPA